MKVQALERAFDILELLSVEQKGLTLTEIGHKLELHKSTVYRLLSVLKNRGYIEKEDNTNLYRLGLGFIELSSSYLNNIELKTEAQPFLRSLSRIVNQTIFLATFLDDEVVYIDKMEQFNSLRKYSIIGQRRPLYCTSLGKSYLTGMNNQAIKNMFKDTELTAFTKNTITSLQALTKEIEKSRRRGWAFDNEEYELGVQCIGAPIYDYRNKIIAALSMAWNIYSTKVNIEECAQYVKETAYNISRRLGYQKQDKG